MVKDRKPGVLQATGSWVRHEASDWTTASRQAMELENGTSSMRLVPSVPLKHPTQQRRASEEQADCKWTRALGTRVCHRTYQREPSPVHPSGPIQAPDLRETRTSEAVPLGLFSCPGSAERPNAGAETPQASPSSPGWAGWVQPPRTQVSTDLKAPEWLLELSQVAKAPAHARTCLPKSLPPTKRAWTKFRDRVTSTASRRRMLLAASSPIPWGFGVRCLEAAFQASPPGLGATGWQQSYSHPTVTAHTSRAGAVQEDPSRQNRGGRRLGKKQIR